MRVEAECESAVHTVEVFLLTKDESGMPVSRYFGTLRLRLRLPVDLGHAEVLGYEVCGPRGGL